MNNHVIIYHWVHRFTPLLIDAARPCWHAAGDRSYVDDAYKVAGRYVYLYRATDQYGQVLDVLVSSRRIWRPPAGWLMRSLLQLVQSVPGTDAGRPLTCLAGCGHY